MAHFLKMTDGDGAVSYMNLDMIAEVDEEERTVTLVNDTTYEFDDELNVVVLRFGMAIRSVRGYSLVVIGYM